MTLSAARARHYLKTRDFERLFSEELGWDRHAGTLTVTVADQTYTLRALAQKRGVQIFTCSPDPDGRIPDYAARRKIEKQVAKSAFEHLLIFVDGRDGGRQIWQWVLREPGRPAAYREIHFDAGHQTGDLLIQKFESINFPLSAEESLSLTGVVHRLRDAFDRDRLTKRFYDQFKLEHAAFLGLIKGIKDQADREWYASLMLNRLMFIWFIQQKCFLDGNAAYLHDRLRLVQSRRGKGKFLSFYRQFLRRLFHEGLGQQKPQRSPDLEDLLGDIPYLNGGLFEVHELEENNPDLDIPDEAFEKLFDFFGQWDWHLDERPLASGREINPDVLGYIFEKYINQKQMGAYYTKEDITEYIGKSTIIPYLFDAARKKCTVAFEPGSAVWNLLREDPDRYIYEPVRRGVIGRDGAVIPETVLPDFVRKGMHDPKKRMFDRRYNLAEADLQDPEGRKLTLPTETWREYVNRRRRCLDIRERLAAGEIHEINELVTLNLDARQFAEDVIASCEGPELLRAFFQVIKSVSVLDPTCGSGAFLFAGLNILEALYEACIDRMQVFLEDLERSGERHRPEKFSDFKRILADVEKHPNRRYFILKSIMVNNLYGVDIMEEAVEICKLRLFLKLVAQVDRQDQLEPLPDIDFNIRAGNTLVGFVSREEVKRATETRGSRQVGLLFPETSQALMRIEEEAEIVDRAFQKFHEMQTNEGVASAQFSNAKQELRGRLARLSDQLDIYLAKEYGIESNKTRDFERWRLSHQPFHWFAEFFGIMKSGGFSVIIGNPPWIEYSKVRKEYLVRGFVTEDAGNLHGLCTERGLSLLATGGNMSFIVQLPVTSSSRMLSARRVLREYSSSLHVATFDDRPGKLFEGLQHCRAAIWGVRKKPKVTTEPGTLFTAKYQRWPSELRPSLFQEMSYCGVQQQPGLGDPFPKYDAGVAGVLGKLTNSGLKTLGSSVLPRASAHFVFYQEAAQYWMKAVVGLPYYSKNKEKGAPAHGRYLYLSSRNQASAACALINSSLFYLYFIAFSDCFHLNDSLVQSFPLPDGILEDQELSKLGEVLMRELKANAERKTIRTRDGDEILYDEYFGRKAKASIDKIDQYLAAEYGYAPEDLDFVVNYDAKYRMGQSESDEE